MSLSDYELLEPPLGEGSFGVVYRAVFRGVQWRAVKLLVPGRADLGMMQRELERIGAVKEHPGIVTIYDFELGGERPYLAMGLHAGQADDGSWRGRTLEDRRGRAERRELVRLLGEIMDALAYLHGHGVVHCDIKPSNVLLTDEGRAKLCDFGQSRLAGVALDERSGTPLYSSPEQLRAPSESGEGRGLRWDVYSFGVVAYELATGQLPRLASWGSGAAGAAGEGGATAAALKTLYDGADGGGEGAVSGEELAGLIEACGEEIAWPAGAAEHLAREERELIGRCLRLEPGGRPSDMIAVRDAWDAVGRERRLRRLRRITVGLAALSALAVVGLGQALWQWSSAERERERALAAERSAATARDKAEDMLEFLLYQLRDELESVGRVDIVESVQEEVAAFYEELGEDIDDVRRLRNRIAAHLSAAASHQAAGRSDEAGKQYGRAVELARELDGRERGSVSARRLLAVTLADRVSYLLGRGAPGEALELAQELGELSAELLERAEGGAPGEIKQAGRDLSVAWERIGQVFLHLGETEEALREFLRAEELTRLLAEDWPDDLPLRYDHATSLQRVGELYAAMGRVEDAEAAYGECRAILEELLAERPERLPWRYGYAVVLDRMGDLMARRGLWREAAPIFERSLEVAGGLAAEDGKNVTWVAAEAVAHSKVAEVRMQEGEPEAASHHYGRALEIQETLCEIEPELLGHWQNLAVYLTKIGGLHQAAGQWEAAEGALKRALEIVRRVVGEDPQQVAPRRHLAAVLGILGGLAERRGELGRAEEYYGEGLEESIALAEGADATVDLIRDVAIGHNRLGALCLAGGRLSEAVEHHREAVRWSERLVGIDPEHPVFTHDVVYSRSRLIEALLASESWEEATAQVAMGLEEAERRWRADGAQLSRVADLAWMRIQGAELSLRRGDGERAREQAAAAAGVIRTVEGALVGETVDLYLAQLLGRALATWVEVVGEADRGELESACELMGEAIDALGEAGGGGGAAAKFLEGLLGEVRARLDGHGAGAGG